MILKPRLSLDIWLFITKTENCKIYSLCWLWAVLQDITRQRLCITLENKERTNSNTPSQNVFQGEINFDDNFALLF